MFLEVVFSLVCLFSCVHHGIADPTNVTAPLIQAHCLQCERVASPDDCVTSVLCSPGEVCMSEQYITSDGYMFYDLGCKLASICSTAGFTVSAAEIQQRRAGQPRATGQPLIGRRRRQSIAVHACEECCEDDFCNNYLCGGHETQLLKCAGCVDMRNMTNCDKIAVCQPHEVCYIEERITDAFELLYNGGCERQKQCEAFKNNQHTGTSLFDPCFNCCNSSFCNVICPSDLHPTIPPTTPPTITSTTTPTTPPTMPSTTPVVTTTQTTMIPSTICPTFPPLASVGAPQVLHNALVNVGCGGKDDIVFLVDDSTHVPGAQERLFQLFTKAFVDSLQVGPEKARVGYASYNSVVQEVIHLDQGSDPEIVDKKLLNLAHAVTVTQDKALLGAAINHVLGDMYSGKYSRSGAKKHLVILTGNATDDINEAVAAADKAKRRGIEVIVVAVGDISHTQQQLHKIPTSAFKRHFLNVNDFEGLRPEIESLILSHCRGNDPVPTIASDPCAGPKLLNFLGCGAREDITFILDRSGSIHSNDWIKMNDFLQKLVGKFDVSPNASRIGMMTFNNQLIELIHFKDFSDKTSLLNEINFKLSSLHTTGDTMTHLALEKALQWYQQSSSSDAIKVVVIFTDGGSDSKFETLASALELQRNNVTIFVVGIGHEVDLQEQMILASDPDSEHMLNVQNFDGLLLYMEYLAAVRCRDLANMSSTPPSSTLPSSTPPSSTHNVNTG